MSDVDAFTALAEKLPPDQRARFLAMSIQLKNLPPDDELSVALEALGFTTLILKEIPQEISEAIGKARSGLSDSQREGLREDIEEILVRSLDTPSYKDLRETIRQMKDHHSRIQRETGNLAKSLAKTRAWLERRNAVIPSLALGLCSGVIGGAIVLGATFFAKPKAVAPITKSVLPPAIEKRLDYFEVDLPDFGGNVGIVTIGGEVLSAFKDGSDGVVVIKATEKSNAPGSLR
jgi:hypothetical protein